MGGIEWVAVSEDKEVWVEGRRIIGDLDSQAEEFIFLFFNLATPCGILVPRTGIEPAPSAVKARSPNHWTAREFPGRGI